MEHKNIIIQEVEEYSPKVVEAIRHLVQQLDSNFQPLSDEDVKFMFNSSNTHIYVALTEETNQIVGMVTLIVYRIPYKMKAQLEDIVVDESFRGLGIGTKLMEHAIASARDLKVKSLNFTSRPTRESGNKLYEKLGFERRETNVYRINL